MKSEKVIKAQRHGDYDALSQMGRKGAEAANRKRAEKRDIEEAIEAEYRARKLSKIDDAEAMQIARRDDLIPEDDR